MQSIARHSTTQLLARTFASRPGFVAARTVSTQTMSANEGYEYLNKQRALRPSSPWHIYQPQLTSLSSIANRATGAGLSAAFYALFLSHLAAPAFGANLDSATLLELFTSLPGYLQVSAKALVAGPAVYHTLNGFRHLGWDMGYFLQLKSSYMAGYVVIGASVVGTAAVLAL
ncbi:hypothetical protein JCM6882_004679 [Rhodosporidiobolus microsporus]